MSLTASTTMSAATLPIVRAGDQCRKQFKPIASVPAVLHPLGMQSQLINNRRRLICPAQQKRGSIICSSALNARCAEGQTQTVTRESSTITVAPVQGKEKSPDLDDGGTGFPPRDDDGGGGGGGGGGGNWKGGFFFFGFLAFLGLLKDQEDEGLPGSTQKMKNQHAIYINIEIKEVWKPESCNGLPSLLSSHGFEQQQ